MITNIKNFVWVAAMTLGAFSIPMNASANNALNSMMMTAAPDGEEQEAEPITWIEVTMESAGSLGVEVMYKVDKLEDVDYLKIKGTLNAADWTTLKNMSQLKGIDLREASFDAIPESEFNGKTTLIIAYLPEGMKTIGNSAFYRTSLTSIDIPASVTTIGNNAFYEVKTLTEVNFAGESALETIGSSAFYNCTALTKFFMPNTVTSLGGSAFYQCSALAVLTLSSSLTEIPDYCFYSTGSLKNIAFPEKLRSIGNSAFAYSGLEDVVLPSGLTQLNTSNYYYYSGSFSYCKSLKYVELPVHVNNYRYTFRDCTSLTTIVCPSSTPPAVDNDPFYGVNRSQLTLKVPSFAIVDFKLDTYWLNFGTIEAMDVDPTNLNLYSKLSLTNNRRPNSSPTIGLQSGGSLIVGGDAPFAVEELGFVENLPNKIYGQLVNRSKMSVTGKVTTNYYVKSGTWYFLTPFTDVSLSEVTHSADASYVFRYYDSENRAANGTKDNASWKNVTDEVLKAGQGYIFHCNKEGWLRLPATEESKAKAVASTDVTTELNAYASENVANANWNYIGNPYPCYYDVYYMDFTAPITVRDGNNYKAYSIVDDNFVLAPMQSFFVQKPDEVSSILFKEAGRQIESTVNRASARTRSVNAERKIYNFMLSDGFNTDETRVIINDQASLGYELSCDAAKFMSSDEAMPQLYTADTEGNLLAFNERPLADGKVKLGFFAGKAGRYTIGLSSAFADVQLHDALTGQTVSLKENPYQFDVQASGTFDDRFTLIFTGGNATAIHETEAAGTAVNFIAGGVEVKASTDTDIIVYRADGSQQTAAKVQGGTTVISLPAGLYIIKAGKDTFKGIVY